MYRVTNWIVEAPAMNGLHRVFRAFDTERDTQQFLITLPLSQRGQAALWEM